MGTAPVYTPDLFSHGADAIPLVRRPGCTGHTSTDDARSRLRLRGHVVATQEGADAVLAWMALALLPLLVSSHLLCQHESVPLRIQYFCASIAFAPGDC
jgi:hypothetical protein